MGLTCATSENVVSTLTMQKGTDKGKDSEDTLRNRDDKLLPGCVCTCADEKQCRLKVRCDAESKISSMGLRKLVVAERV